jgi:fucose 4-O-acetylase-like acetyltransferase
MANSIIIPNRINWIDWAKVIAISFVVFGHIPAEPENFIHKYITSFHMPLFFFISGFLTKKEYMSVTTLKKYWHTLIIPYLCYNIIFYPYWLVRFLTDHQAFSWFDFIKPFIGTIFLQIKTPYTDYLNGVTWFISSLLVMKITLSICNKYKFGKYIIVLLMLVTAIFYVINEFYLFVSTLTPVSFVKCFPFFFLGYFSRQKGIISEECHRKDIATCIGGLLLGAITYTIVRERYSIPLYGITYWIMCLSSIIGIFSLCKILDGVRSRIIENISIGTIVIMGLHWMFIGTTNFIITKILHISGAITYPLYIIVLLTLLFIVLEYPLIIWFKNRWPFLLGKRQNVMN